MDFQISQTLSFITVISGLVTIATFLSNCISTTEDWQSSRPAEPSKSSIIASAVSFIVLAIAVAAKLIFS